MQKVHVIFNQFTIVSLFLILLFGCSTSISAQAKSSKTDKDIFEYKDLEVKPEILKKVSPYYPEIARKSGTQGVVIVKVLIDKKGIVEKTELFKSIETLDEAALKAAKQYQFKPGKYKGKAVKVWMNIPFKFKLK